MSVRDINKVIIVTNALTGQVIDSIKFENYNYDTINNMIIDFIDRYIYDNENGLILKVGYNN